MVVEIGLITPPVGLNVFIISSMAKDTSMKETFIGIIPFLMSDLLRIALIVFVPSIALIALKLVAKRQGYRLSRFLVAGRRFASADS
jgi:TRAP-type C4-dicarboxylate transport system permease large subunit